MPFTPTPMWQPPEQWTTLNAAEAEKLCKVPAAVAAHPGNQFFALLIEPWDYDGKRPFVALLEQPEQPGLVSLHICTIPGDVFDEAEDWFENFNPLSGPFNYLSLNFKQTTGLSVLLRARAERLPRSSQALDACFKLLDREERVSLRLPVFWLEADSECYRVTRHNAPVTLLRLTPPLHTQVWIEIAQFDLKDLEDPTFTSETASAQITLDREGLEELAALLEARLPG